MKIRKLGNTGIEISEIGLGTNYIGGHNLYEAVDEAAGIQIVRQALELGINFIDTADIYGMGRSEELIGQALNKHKYQVIVATKGGITFDGLNRTGISNHPTYLRKALEASLKRLARDYIDLYYIHRPDGRTPPEEAYGTLMKFKEEGLIRAGGVSNFELPDLKAALTAGPIDALQSCYNIFQREVETEILPFCRLSQISFIPWGPLAFGLLGGRYTSDFQLSEKDWRHRTGLFETDVFNGNLEIVNQLKKIAENRGISIPQLAIQWLLSHQEIGSVIAGAKHPDQVRHNSQASSQKLTSDDIARIDALTG